MSARRTPDSAPVKEHISFIGPAVAFRHPDKLGLSAAVGADQRDKFALVYLKGEISEFGAVAQLLGDIPE